MGAGAFNDYKEYDKTQNARMVVINLAGNVYYSPNPLSADQGEQLARTIAANTEQKKRPLVTDREGRIIYSLYTETDWAKVDDAACNVLLPSQLQTFRSLVEQQRLDTRLSAVTIAANQSSPKPGG